MNEHTPPRGGALIDPHEVIARLDRIDERTHATHNRTLETHATILSMRRELKAVRRSYVARAWYERAAIVAIAAGVIALAIVAVMRERTASAARDRDAVVIVRGEP